MSKRPRRNRKIILSMINLRIWKLNWLEILRPSNQLIIKINISKSKARILIVQLKRCRRSNKCTKRAKKSTQSSLRRTMMNSLVNKMKLIQLLISSVSKPKIKILKNSRNLSWDLRFMMILRNYIIKPFRKLQYFKTKLSHSEMNTNKWSKWY